MECAGERFASRCGHGRPIRAHHCSRFLKPCSIMRPNRPSVAAAARKPRARRMALRGMNWRSMN
eukprot:696068-Lingulodinium_polyedra.AAC.1